MMPGAVAVTLGEILCRSTQTTEIEPLKSYREITVRMWGKGVIQRGTIAGAEVGNGRRFVAVPGQFIISRIDARHGANGLVPDSLGGAIVTNDFPLFNIDHSQLEPRYLHWMARTPTFVEFCQKASEGTTNRVRLSEERFLKLRINLPPLIEQRRIVARMENVLTQVTQAQALRTQQQTDVGRLLFSAFHRIASGAPRSQMRQVAPLVRRPVTISFDTTYPELGVRSFFKGTLFKPALSGFELGAKRVFWIEPGDLIFSNVFAWEGAIAIATPNDANRVGSHRFITCVPVPEVAEAQFLLQYFKTSEGFARIQEASPGGAGRNRTLGLDALANIDVPLPSIQKQKWFAELHRKVENLTATQASVDPHYDAMIPAVLESAFTAPLAAAGPMADGERAR